MHIQYITLGLTKNMYWFKELVFAPLRYCGFSARVKSFVLQNLKLAETRVFPTGGVEECPH